jgi:hypothetical protein
MKFRYYVVELDEGKVLGTDSSEEAEQFADAEEYFVIDSQEGMWMLPDGESTEIIRA